jgi:hypothetical protein
MTFVRHLPSGVIYCVPAVLYICLLGSGFFRAIMGHESLLPKLSMVMFSLGIMLPTALSCILIARNLKIYKGWKEILGIGMLFITSITVFVGFAYLIEITPAGGFEGYLWLVVFMIQFILYAGMTWITDQIT